MANGDFDPNDVNAWRTVLHKAAAALHANPSDAEARDWVQRAQQNIGDLEDIANKKDKREASDLGKGTAFALGAARGLSFGLGDLAQKYTDTPDEQLAVQTTEGAHPGMTLAGTIAGGAVPFLAAPYASGGLLAGASPVAVRTGLGAAQGFGLTQGDVGERAKGAVLSAALARYAPEAVKFAAKGVSGLAGRIIGAIPKAAAPVAEAATETAPEVTETATIGGMSEDVIRQSLARQGVPPEAMDRTIAALRAGQQAASRGVAPEPSPISEGSPGSNSLRAGEAAEPIPGTEGRGIAVTGTRATPAPPTTPTILEMQGGAVDNFPRGPGGSVRWSTTQLGEPGPNLNSPAALKQLEMLKQLSPTELRAALKNPLFAQIAKDLGLGG